MAGRNPLERYREREIAGKEKRDQKELKKRRRVIRAGYEPLLPALFRPLSRRGAEGFPRGGKLNALVIDFDRLSIYNVRV